MNAKGKSHKGAKKKLSNLQLLHNRYWLILELINFEYRLKRHKQLMIKQKGKGNYY